MLMSSWICISDTYFFFFRHLIIAFSRCNIVYSEVSRDLRRRLKFLATWFQSESLLQETCQTRLKTHRVTSWNCSCQLQITLFWKMIRTFCRYGVSSRIGRYINTSALITSEWEERLTPRNLSEDPGWTCRLFDQERGSLTKHLDHEIVISSLNLNSWTLFLEEPSSNTPHLPTLRSS